MTPTFSFTVGAVGLLGSVFQLHEDSYYREIIAVCVRGCFGLGMLYVNALMLTNFLKSLETYGTLPVTVVW
jgi:hypothetical protein